MKILPDLRNEMNLDEIVGAELSSWNKLLPPRWGDRSLAGSEGKVATWLKSLTRREIEVEPEEVLLARKLGRGARPMVLLGLKERLLYRGAVSLIEAVVGTPSRSFEAYEAFQRAPLETEGCTYVLKADIASYYQYIDHERLVDEVVAQTGDDLAIALAVEILKQSASRTFGLPQLSPVSDVLADVYIDPMRRDLIRAGHRVWRFVDDFRIACRGYGDALRALEDTDHAARGLGLVLNELKTFTPGRDRYEASLTASERRERDLFASLEIEELESDFDEYSDELIPDRLDSRESLLDEAAFEKNEVGGGPEPEDDETVSDAQLAAASMVVNLWVEEEEEEDVQRSEPAQITAKLLGRAIRVFALGNNPAALEHVTAFLVYEPSLTPEIARYLQSTAHFARQVTSDTFDDICNSGIVSAWQALWITYAAGELRGASGGRERAPHVTWLRAQLRNDHAAIRAEAALALARRRLVRPSRLLEIVNGLPSLHRPTGLLALAAVGPERTAIDAAESELDRARIAWGLARL